MQSHCSRKLRCPMQSNRIMKHLCPAIADRLGRSHVRMSGANTFVVDALVFCFQQYVHVPLKWSIRQYHNIATVPSVTMERERSLWIGRCPFGSNKEPHLCIKTNSLNQLAPSRQIVLLNNLFELFALFDEMRIFHVHRRQVFDV